MTHPVLRHQVPKGVTAATVTVRSPRFEADDPAAPVYTIKVPTRRDKIDLQAAMTAEGLDYPSDERLRECARADLRANAQDWKAHVAVIDELEERTAELGRITRDYAERTAAATSEEARKALAEEMAEALKAHEVTQDLLDRFNAIVADVRRNCAAFRQMEADRTRYMETVPLILTARFLVGWTGVDARLQRVGGVVPDELIDLLPNADLQAIAGKVTELLSLSRSAEKN